MPALPWLNTQKKRDHKHTQDCGFVAGKVCFLPLFQFRTVGSVKLFMIIVIIFIFLHVQILSRWNKTSNTVFKKSALWFFCVFSFVFVMLVNKKEPD